MAVKTTLEQLEEVQTAITAVMSGQEYKIGDITFERAALKDLQTREDTLLTRYRRESNNMQMVRANLNDGL